MTPSTSRWDVELLGLDRGRVEGEVLDGAARRLASSSDHVARLLARVPTTLVADLDETAARTLVSDLRALGLRVKPRLALETAAPPSAPAPTRGREVVALEIGGTGSDEPALELQVAEDDLPRGSALEVLSAGSADGPSGLELDDAAMPAPRTRRDPPPSRPISAPPPPAEPVVDDAPRVFWSALPSAFLVPLRSPVLPGLLVAPLCLAVAIVMSVMGTLTALVGLLVGTAAFVGVALQVSHRCLWATAVGERMPASLPSDFLSEYAFPGLGVLLVQGIVGGLCGWLALRAREMGAPLWTIEAGAVLFALYGVIGFALAAASRSAVGYLDVARIARILLRAPVEVIVISLVGMLVQGGAVAVAIAQLVAVQAAGGGFGSALMATVGAVFVLALAAAYGAALTATMMGMLFWARPEVANG